MAARKSSRGKPTPGKGLGKRVREKGNPHSQSSFAEKAVQLGGVKIESSEGQKPGRMGSNGITVLYQEKQKRTYQKGKHRKGGGGAQKREGPTGGRKKLMF